MCEVQNLRGMMILQNLFSYHQPLSQAAILKLHDTTYVSLLANLCINVYGNMVQLLIKL